MSSGAPATSACISGFLLSRMRSGLPSRRRRLSASSAGFVRAEICDQQLAVRPASFRRAERIDLQADALDTEIAPQPRRQRDQLRIHIGTGVTRPLRRRADGTAGSGPPGASRGGTSGPMHHSLCRWPRNMRLEMTAAHHAGRRFGAQRQALAALGLEACTSPCRRHR